MKKIYFLPVVLGLSLAGSVGQAEASCVSGAVIGGIAGHVLGHHGLIGAAAGCAIGASHRRHSWRRRYDDRGYGYERPYGYGQPSGY